MGVYESATKLATDIKNSKEYKDFRKSMNEIKKDKENEKLLTEYRKLQIEMQRFLISNKPIDKKFTRKFENTQNKINANKKLYNYLINEQKLTSMMDSVNKILAKAVEKDYQ